MECERKGYAWLRTESNRTLVVPTVCKTWGCGKCAQLVMSRFRLRVAVGCSVLQPCAFTTFTFRLEGEPVDASYVARTWKAFFRKWKRLEAPFEWLKVVELTQAGQPHLHLVMGPVTGRIRCYGKRRLGEAWFLKDRECQCLSHRLSRVWHIVTGNSWHVHTTPVMSAKGAGGYLAKYMAKGGSQRELLEAAGFERRFSSSRGWPATGTMQLEQTLGRGWKDTAFLPFKSQAVNPPDLARMKGPSWLMREIEEQVEKAAERRVRRMLVSAADEGAEDEPARSGGGDR